jgi:DNA-binding response OmpR family regulator
MSLVPPGPILVVESDRRLGEAITEQLLADGFSVKLARSVEHARILASATAPALAVLGWLDSPSGALDLLREIRRAPLPDGPWERTLPAIVVDGDARELDMLRAFDEGADDYLPRPTTYLELRARLRAILRRTLSQPGRQHVIEVGALAIDTHAHSVMLDGREIELRRMEFELLAHLAREPERVFTRVELLRAVWGYGAGPASRTVDSHASRLRRKLGSAPAREWVVSVWGVGYRLT